MNGRKIERNSHIFSIISQIPYYISSRNLVILFFHTFSQKIKSIIKICKILKISTVRKVRHFLWLILHQAIFIKRIFVNTNSMWLMSEYNGSIFHLFKIASSVAKLVSWEKGFCTSSYWKYHLNLVRMRRRTTAKYFQEYHCYYSSHYLFSRNVKTFLGEKW